MKKQTLTPRIEGTTYFNGLNFIVATQAFVDMEMRGRKHITPTVFDRFASDLAVVSSVTADGDFAGGWLVSLEKSSQDEPKVLVFPRNSSRTLNSKEIHHLRNSGGEAVTDFLFRMTGGSGEIFRVLKLIESLPSLEEEG